MCKFAKQFDGFPVVSACGFFLIEKNPEIHPFLIEANTHIPFIAIFSPRNPLISAFVIGANFLILAILNVCAGAKVVAAAIEDIMVFVVNLHARVRYPQNETVQLYYAVLAVAIIISGCIKSLDVWSPVSAPAMLRYALIILLVNKSYLSLRQGNFAIRFKEWERHGGIASVVALAGC